MGKLTFYYTTTMVFLPCGTTVERLHKRSLIKIGIGVMHASIIIMKRIQRGVLSNKFHILE